MVKGKCLLVCFVLLFFTGQFSVFVWAANTPQKSALSSTNGQKSSVKVVEQTPSQAASQSSVSNNQSLKSIKQNTKNEVDPLAELITNALVVLMAAFIGALIPGIIAWKVNQRNLELQTKIEAERVKRDQDRQDYEGQREKERREYEERREKERVNYQQQFNNLNEKIRLKDEKLIQLQLKKIKEEKIAELSGADEHQDQKRNKKQLDNLARYKKSLEEHRTEIPIIGSVDNNYKINIRHLDVFMPLKLTFKSPNREMVGEKSERESFNEFYLMSERPLQEAFGSSRLLVIEGEPGAGKSTLLDHMILMAIDDEIEQFGFGKTVIPIFLQLRFIPKINKELSADNKAKKKLSLPQVLWCYTRDNITELDSDCFETWLRCKDDNYIPLVLLDGLDEISDTKQRTAIGSWVDGLIIDYPKVYFVITSRPYVLKGTRDKAVRFDKDNTRAEVKNFKVPEQDLFIEKYLGALYTKEDEHRQAQQRRTDEDVKKKAQKIIDFIDKEDEKYQLTTENKKQETIRQLLTNPLLLQLFIAVYRNRPVVRRTRHGLYEVFLNFLLGERDSNRDWPPPFPVNICINLLSQIAYDMQQSENKDDIPMVIMHKKVGNYISSKLKSTDYTGEEFCLWAMNRAHILREASPKEYGFIHGSFREYLAAYRLELNYPAVVKSDELVELMMEDKWTEVISFMFNRLDETRSDKFKQFIIACFKRDEKWLLNPKVQGRIKQLINELQDDCVDVSAFEQILFDDGASVGKKIFAIGCLQEINKKPAYEVVANYVRIKANIAIDILKICRLTLDIPHIGFGRLFSSSLELVNTLIKKQTAKKVTTAGQEKTIFNPHEFDAEYIFIPEGQYVYDSEDGLGEQNVDSLYFAKYPVTNRQYGRFIQFLQGKGEDACLKMDVFKKKLLQFSKTVKGNYQPSYTDYLQKSSWEKLLLSRYSDDKDFYGADQPVVGISWYAARTYAFWLSCLAASEKKPINDVDVGILANIYRLPEEKEWLWAAGRPEKGNDLREYPWGSDVEPNEELANYDENIGKTTPVGSYPKGATVDGLMDMAGNVWEWQGNWKNSDEEYRALRGGSWDSSADILPCSARNDYVPDGRSDYIGFRVVRQSLLKL